MLAKFRDPTGAFYIALAIMLCIWAYRVVGSFTHVQADPVPVYQQGDFDYDEDVDLFDFALFQRNFSSEYWGGP